MEAVKEKRALEAVSFFVMRPLKSAMPKLEKLGWYLINWDFEQGVCLTLGKKDRVLLFEFENPDPGREAYHHARYFNAQVRDPFSSEGLSREGRVIADIVINNIEKGFSALPRIDRPKISRKMEVREIIVNRVLMPEGKKQYYMNPYVGCTIGCSFCYVAGRADFSRGLEGLPELKWGRYVNVKINAPEIIAEEAGKFPPGTVRLSPLATDPYQPIERKYRITRRCLEKLREGGFIPVILTRSGSVLEDIDLLKSFENAAVGFSIPTDDDRYRRIFEPGACPVEERFEALERCHNAGLATFACIQPIFPMNVEQMLNRIAPFVSSVRIDRMNFVEKVMSLYVESNIEYAATEVFFDEIEGRLREGFHNRGIPVYEYDDMETLKV